MRAEGELSSSHPRRVSLTALVEREPDTLLTKELESNPGQGA